MENKMTPKQLLDRLVYAIKHEVNYYSNFTQSEPLINQDYNIVEKALTELEETKKINEIFKNAITIKHTDIHFEEKLDHSKDTFIYSIQPICEVIQNNIEEELKRHLREWVLKNAFPQELKTLEIIKEKVMPLVSLEDEDSICKPNQYRVYDNELYQSTALTQEEYDLLKEWLK